MIPLCLDQGVGLIPWSPIARGRLARPAGAATKRSESDFFAKRLYSDTTDADNRVIGAVEAVAHELGRPMAQVALAWVRQKQGVAAPIIGASRLDQLREAIAGLDLVLAPEQVVRLEEAYALHPALVI